MLRIWLNVAGAAEETDPFDFLNGLRAGQRSRYLLWADRGPANLERIRSFLRLAAELGDEDVVKRAVLACPDPDRALLEAMSSLGVEMFSPAQPHFGRFPRMGDLIPIKELARLLCPWFTATGHEPECGSVHGRMKINEWKTRNWCLTSKEACTVYMVPSTDHGREILSASGARPNDTPT